MEGVNSFSIFMAGSSTLLWEWALYCVALRSSQKICNYFEVLQLNRNRNIISPFLFFILYTILKIALILLEAALVAFIAIDHRWEKDLPFDPTRELQSLRIFIEENIDICKWAGITVLIIQVCSTVIYK
ncbi:hypothetical protein DKX38_003615 [Salix brachista]|uniref:Uncharacterized protein n=1 Tax=Salix brachista TaxID=2182728 RepID=A0A5N5NR77_9ROSI|nr:hypothetical protein DKX38_003615 [Salix brachista]